MSCRHSRQKCLDGVWFCKHCGIEIAPKQPVDWSDGVPAQFIGSGSEYFDVSLGRVIEDRHHRNRVLKEEGWIPVDERILKDAGEALKEQKAVKQKRIDRVFAEATTKDLVDFVAQCPPEDPNPSK